MLSDFALHEFDSELARRDFAQIRIPDFSAGLD